MLIVAALGGNALLKRGEAQSSANQRANVRRAAQHLARLVASGHRLVITHGNGPQVGMLALQSEAGPAEARMPLDVLDAESEGMIGYMVEQELRNHLPSGSRVAALLTQVVVDTGDPAFAEPDKPIGPVYTVQPPAAELAARGWRMKPEGQGWRRVVASPQPLEILEQPEIATLLGQGVTVICTGGGGIPCARAADGSLTGVEAVVDKDRASALLAIKLAADCLLLLTDVDAAYVGYGTPQARAIAEADPASLRARIGDFPAGSMRPKIDAACHFAEATGRRAGIGRLEDAEALAAGAAGTTVTAGAAGLRFRA